MRMAKLVTACLGCIAVFTAFAGRGAEVGGESPTAIVTVCAVCHGTRGEGIEARSAPRLAGLPSDFITSQLNAFANNRRGGQRGDPYGSQMAVLAKSLKPDDIAVISAYYGKLPEVQPFRTMKGDSANGKRLFAMCAACHGPQGAGLPEVHAPRLAGQADWYIARSLGQYRSGLRGNDPADTAGGSMAAAAAALSGNRDIRDVSVYASQLGIH